MKFPKHIAILTLLLFTSLLASYIPLGSSSDEYDGTNIPTSTIALWSGEIADIPDGWSLCGDNTWPNITYKFALGVSSDEQPTDNLYFQGVESHTHNYSEIPLHGHDITDPGHSHQFEEADVSYPAVSGMTNALPFDFYPASTSLGFTGISVVSNGTLSAETDSQSLLPACINLAFIYKKFPDAGLAPGIILYWFRPLDEIPSGWAICNGEQGTPDMTNRYVRGVASDLEIGSTIDNSLHSHTYSDIPTHTHNVTDPGHRHSYNPIFTVPLEIDDYPDEINTQVPGNVIWEYTTNEQTGITINSNGSAICTTEETLLEPPYYEVTYIMKLTEDTTLDKNLGFFYGQPNKYLSDPWFQLNGTDGLPNMCDKFLKGAGDLEDPGATGGSETHTHIYTELPQHSHSIIDPGHSHYYICSEGIHFEMVNLGTIDDDEVPYDHYRGFYDTNTTTCGISIDPVGIFNCETEPESYMPPYYKLAMITYGKLPDKAIPGFSTAILIGIIGIVVVIMTLRNKKFQ